MPTIGFTFGGRPFKPTRGTSYEAGIKYQPTLFKGLFTAAVYQITLDNALTPDPNPLHLGTSIQTGQIRSKGIELEGTARFSDALSLNLAYSYTDAKTRRSTDPTQLGKRVLLVPKHTAAALADYTIRSGPLLGFGFGAGARYVGNVFGDPTNALKTRSFTLVDALAHYDLPHWRLALNANNLLDKTYLTSCYSFDSCTYGSRRTILLTASYHL